MMKKIIAFVATLFFALTTLVGLSQSAFAGCEPDSRTYTDRVPYGSYGYTRVYVTLYTIDCGSVRYLDYVRVSYNEDRVHFLYNVILRTDGRNDGSWDIRRTWDIMREGTNHYAGEGGCTDPCDVKFTGMFDIKSPYSDQFFATHGLAEL